MAVVASVTDVLGRRVILRSDRWDHIVSGHPEIGAHLEVVLAAVRRPDVWHPGHEQQEEWFYLRDAGPSRWLKVVVLYDHDKGSIVTAFARRRMP